MSDNEDISGRLDTGYEEDLGDSFEDDLGEEKDEFVSERNVFERAGRQDPFAEMFSKEEPSDSREHILWVKQLSKKERFFYTLREVVNECSETIEKIDAKVLVEKIKNVDGLQYKNSWGIVLGYLATNGGQRLEKRRVLSVIEKVPETIKKEFGIEKPDIIRYARYWSLYL